MEEGKMRYIDEITRDLEPCPFCAGTDVEMREDIHSGRIRVMCWGCGAEVEFKFMESHTLDTVRARWNRRSGE